MAGTAAAVRRRKVSAAAFSRVDGSSGSLVDEVATQIRSRIEDGQFARSIDSLVRRDVRAQIWNFRKQSFDYRIYVTDGRGIVVANLRRQCGDQHQ